MLTTHAGETLRLRFAEVDNVNVFMMGVDDVRFTSNEVPEPAPLLLMGIAMLVLLAVQTHPRNQRRG